MPSVVSTAFLVNGRQISMNGQGGWTVNETLQAKFDAMFEPDDDPLDFVGDVMLPSIGSAHPYNSSLFLNTVPSANFANNSLSTINFGLEYSTLRPAASQFQRERYIDSTTADKSWSFRQTAIPVEEAYVSDDAGATFSSSKKPVQSTLGELFVPGITKTRYMPVCRYVRNETVTPAGILTVPGCVNNDSVTIDGKSVTARQALIVSLGVSSWKRFEGYNFRTVDYEIVIKDDGWDESILNKGFYYWQPLTGGGFKRQRVLIPNGIDDEGNERPWVYAEEPVVLDKDGMYLAKFVTLPGAGHAESDFVPHYRKFRYHTAISFSALGFT